MKRMYAWIVTTWFDLKNCFYILQVFIKIFVQCFTMILNFYGLNFAVVMVNFFLTKLNKCFTFDVKNNRMNKF